jgi:hypothetical protein
METGARRACFFPFVRGHLTSMAEKSFKHGQAVEWESSQGTVHGTVEKTVTATTRVKGHVAKATPEHPEVLVKSSKTGAEAVHAPSALHAAKTSK